MLRFAMKLQQLTGPVMAKGVEDTVFYIYNRLVSLNEVGGEPERFGARARDLPPPQPGARRAVAARDARARRPTTPSAARTCARASTCSRRCPSEWEAEVAAWAKLNARHKVHVGEERAPDGNDEYLLYQTLLGAWPMGEGAALSSREDFVQRITAYMLKAIKEAKVNTSWVNANAAYDEAMARLRRPLPRPEAERAVPRAARGVPAAARARGPGQRARAAAAQDRVARRPRLLPGHRAVGPVARRSRQPAPGRLRAPRAAARPSSTRAPRPTSRACAASSGAARRRPGEAVPHLARAALPQRATRSCSSHGGVPGARRRGRARPTTRWRSRAPTERTRSSAPSPG